MNSGPRTNPFVGLRPFEAEDSLLFFGRHQQTIELMQRLHDTRFVAVVGSSGCGKSSLVRAGLIPKLQAGLLVGDRDRWHIVKMKPGDNPIDNLARALSESMGGAGDSSEAIGPVIREQGMPGIIDNFAVQWGTQDSNVLLLVDQFEEIFRFGLQSGGSWLEEAADFISIMLDLAAQRAFPVYVIMTMRSDFLGDCDRFLGLPEALNRGQYLVPRLTRQQRREAIEGPVQLYAGQIRSRLTDRLLNETIDTRDDLPVFQHALMRTWECWRDKGDAAIDVEHYEAVGTIHHALMNDAEQALQDMSEHEIFLTKRLFQALTTIDEGNRRIRRPAKLNDVAARSDVELTDIWQIIQKFRTGGRSFLIVSTEDANNNPLIDISHESLIRQWHTLGKWVDEEAASVKIYLRLAETALLFNENKAGLYRDPDLQVALDWQEQETPNEVWARGHHGAFDQAMTFLKISKGARDLAIAEELLQFRWRRWRLFIAGFVVALFLDSHFDLGIGLHEIWNSILFNVGVNLSYLDISWKIEEGVVNIFRATTHLALFLGLAYLGNRMHRRFYLSRIRTEVSRGVLSTQALETDTHEYAGFWRRFVAMGIDFIAWYTLSIAFFLTFISVSGVEEFLNFAVVDSEAGFTVILITLMPYVLAWLYEAFMISSSHQATLGKMALGILVTDMQGDRVSFGRATKRFLGKFISLFLLIGFIVQPFTAKRQALHDIMAGCKVMYSPRKYRRSQVLT